MKLFDHMFAWLSALAAIACVGYAVVLVARAATTASWDDAGQAGLMLLIAFMLLVMGGIAAGKSE